MFRLTPGKKRLPEYSEDFFTFSEQTHRYLSGAATQWGILQRLRHKAERRNLDNSQTEHVTKKCRFL
jgi:hypothetical protein